MALMIKSTKAPGSSGTRYKCAAPGCNKRYASTDGVRKHARKAHAEWLKIVDQGAPLRDKGEASKPSTYCTIETDVFDVDLGEGASPAEDIPNIMDGGRPVRRLSSTGDVVLELDRGTPERPESADLWPWAAPGVAPVPSLDGFAPSRLMRGNSSSVSGSGSSAAAPLEQEQSEAALQCLTPPMCGLYAPSRACGTPAPGKSAGHQEGCPQEVCRFALDDDVRQGACDCAPQPQHGAGTSAVWRAEAAESTPPPCAAGEGEPPGSSVSREPSVNQEDAEAFFAALLAA